MIQGNTDEVDVQRDDPPRATERRIPPWKRLEEAWNKIQVGRQGAYSIERLESLDFYVRTTSKTRVILVCVLTPLPALLAAVLLECLPLRAPSEVWAANWVFWIRLGLMELVRSYAGTLQTIGFVPELNFPLYKRLIMMLGTNVALY